MCFIWTCSVVQCQLFFDTLGRSAILLIPQRSIALEWLVLCSWVFMLKKSTALEWLALCLVHCVLGVGATLAYSFLQTWWWPSLARWFSSVLLFENLEHFSSLVNMVQKWGHSWLCLFPVSQLGVTETHDHRMAQSCVTFVLPFL
jgi:hypothetical protein